MSEEQDIREFRNLPHIPRTAELIEFAKNDWPLLKGPTGQNIGTACPAGSPCWLETPEGFDLAKMGDLLVYIYRSRTLWVVSKLFADSLGWSLKNRSENGQENEGSESNGRFPQEETLPFLLDETSG